MTLVLVYFVIHRSSLFYTYIFYYIFPFHSILFHLYPCFLLCMHLISLNFWNGLFGSLTKFIHIQRQRTFTFSGGISCDFYTHGRKSSFHSISAIKSFAKTFVKNVQDQNLKDLLEILSPSVLVWFFLIFTLYFFYICMVSGWPN